MKDSSAKQKNRTKEILDEAEKLLRELGVKRVLLDGPPNDHENFVELGFGGTTIAPERAYDRNTLYEACMVALESDD